MAELLSGRTLILQDGTKVPAEVQLKDKLTLLYFSASWCGPCQRFTPILKNFYENLKASGKNLEVVFISWDETAEDQMEYFRNVHGKWTTMDLETCGNFDKELGDTKFKVDGIPCLKLILPDGTTVLEDATAQLRQPERYCDICRESVGDRWFKCLDCDDYDLCRKCKTHLLLSNEHKFEEKNQTDNKAVEEIWRNWLEEYEKRREKQAMDGGSGARKDATKPEQCCTLDGTCCAE